ncbi:hypothetical protein [Nostoc sp.]|uniref:hypothetical protein n=1 Tax=Nostoc sp. TaxID=1180 RepID=UPI002FF81ADE
MMLEELLAESPVCDRLQYERAIAFSELGDRLFDELADKIATGRQFIAYRPRFVNFAIV